MKLFDRVKQMLSPKKEKQSPNSTVSIGDASYYGKKQNITEEDKQKRTALLTRREYEIYLLLVDGYTLKESAEKLSIKYSTANTHMTGVYKKLGVNSRAELIINYRNINGMDKKGP